MAQKRALQVRVSEKRNGAIQIGRYLRHILFRRHIFIFIQRRSVENLKPIDTLRPLYQTSQIIGMLRLDHRLSDNSQLTARYNYGSQNLFEPFAENQTELPGFGDYVFNRGHNALVQYLKTLSPRTINSVLVGFNRAVRQVFAQNYTTDVNALWGVNYLPTVPRDFRSEEHTSELQSQ